MKLSELKVLVDNALKEEGDIDIEVSLDVSKEDEDFDHRLYGDILEIINQNTHFCIACELTEDNYDNKRIYIPFNETKNEFEVYSRITNKRFTVYAKLKKSKLPLGHYDIENNFANFEDAVNFMLLLNVESKYGTMFCEVSERQKDGSYKIIR